MKRVNNVNIAIACCMTWNKYSYNSLDGTKWYPPKKYNYLKTIVKKDNTYNTSNPQISVKSYQGDCINGIFIKTFNTTSNCAFVTKVYVDIITK